MMVGSFERSDAPVDQTATCDLEEATESGLQRTCGISVHLAARMEMTVVRKVFDGRGRNPRMVSIGWTFTAAFTRLAVCLAYGYVGEIQENGRVK